MLKALWLCFVWALFYGAIFAPVLLCLEPYGTVPPLTAIDTDENQENKSPETPTHGVKQAQFPHPFAPLGVYGAHVIKPGKWLTAYTYGHMAMDGNLIGTDSVSTGALLQRYNVVPVSMSVDMHMVCLMRGMTENFNLMVMVPYYFKTMTMVMRKSPKVMQPGIDIPDACGRNRGPATWGVRTRSIARLCTSWCSMEVSAFQPGP